MGRLLSKRQIKGTAFERDEARSAIHRNRRQDSLLLGYEIHVLGNHTPWKEYETKSLKSLRKS